MFELAEEALLSVICGGTWRGGPAHGFEVAAPDEASVPSCPVAVPPPAY